MRGYPSEDNDDTGKTGKRDRDLRCDAECFSGFHRQVISEYRNSFHALNNCVSSRNAVSFSSARRTKRLPSRCVMGTER